MQFATLLCLRERGPLSQNELGRTVGMQPANIHATVRRLVADGLLTTRPGVNDRRLLLVDLTGKGREVLSRVAPAAAAANARTLSVLSEEERDTLMQLLGKLISPPSLKDHVGARQRDTRRRSHADSSSRNA